MPRGLSKEARREWKRLAPALTQIGILTSADRAFFVAYCEAFASFERASRQIAEHGETIVRDGKSSLSPWVRARNDAALLLHKFGSEFGLSPAIRARFTISERPGEANEFFAD